MYSPDWDWSEFLKKKDMFLYSLWLGETFLKEFFTTDSELSIRYNFLLGYKYLITPTETRNFKIPIKTLWEAGPKFICCIVSNLCTYPT